MLFEKKSLGWKVFILLSLLPLIPWYFALLPFSLRFYNTYSTFTTFGEMLGLVGITMFSLNIILSARLEWFEDFFGGMNRVYIFHHIIGGVAFMLLLSHPLFLATARATTSLKTASMFLLPGEDWSINFGMMGLLFMMGLLILTFFTSLPYQVWLFTHKFLGAVFFIAAIHGFFVASDISRFTPLRIYMFIVISLGVLAYVYRTLLGRFLVKRQTYAVNEVIMKKDNVVEIRLAPVSGNITVIPGQFIFISFTSANVSREIHPFSISLVDESGNIAIAVKAEGDYTSTLKNLQVGEQARIEGGYGRFSYIRYRNNQQIWVAGGIGIVPFLGMASDLRNSEDTVDLYYSVHDEDEAVYLEDLQKVAQETPNFRVIPYPSATKGRLSGEAIEKISGDIVKKDFFICGPPPMMKSLRKQLNVLHVSNRSIHTEEFSIS